MDLGEGLVFLREGRENGTIWAVPDAPSAERDFPLSCVGRRRFGGEGVPLDLALILK